MPAETVAALEALGHSVQLWKPWDIAAGGVCAVLANTTGGTLEGICDPRRPTGAAGW